MPDPLHRHMVQTDECKRQKSPEHERMRQPRQRPLSNDLRLAQHLPDELPYPASNRPQRKVRIFFRLKNRRGVSVQTARKTAPRRASAPASSSTTSTMEKCPGSAKVPKNGSPGITPEPTQRNPTAIQRAASSHPNPSACYALPSAQLAFRTIPEDALVVRQHSRISLPSQSLVADELRAPAPQTYTHHAKHQRKAEHRRAVPVDHGVCPTRRQRPVLTRPQRHQRSDNEALDAEDQEQLSAAAAANPATRPVGALEFVLQRVSVC